MAEEVDIAESDEKKETEQLSVDFILERIRTNKVFGMGGAAFPTYQKLMTTIEAKEKDKILIINGAECDPGLIHDAWLMRNHSEEIQKGVMLLHTCMMFQSIYLAVKDREGLNYSEPIYVHQVPNSYPIGAEKILIEEVLKQNINYNEIPAVSGILVLNVQTVYSIYQAVILNKAVDTRFLTVANLKEKSAKVVKVKLGIKIQEVMEAVYPGIINIFVGGGIMQAHLAEEEDIVDNHVNFLATGMFPSYKESPQCSKCGECNRNCPSGLKVNLIADLVDQGRINQVEKFHVIKCIGCGSCSYSCLAGRDMASKVRAAKEATRL
jgi:Na+-translocating ferredoxin:NAD+ oxidoreductase RnfC subunit